MTSFYGLIGRNLLLSGIMDMLRREPGVRVVVFLPAKRKESYSNFFTSEQVVIEGVESARGLRVNKWIATIFAYLSDFYNWRLQIKIFWKNGHRLNAAFLWTLTKLGHFKFIRQAARWLDYRVMSKEFYKVYFEKYKPDLVFATDVFRSQDINFLREARHRGIATVGMVRSAWDNVSCKGLNRIIPDTLIVNNPVVKEEVVIFNDVDPKQVRVIGVPQYDRYAGGLRTSREEFFKKLNLDPNKKTVIIAPPMQTYVESDPLAKVMVDALKDLPNIQFIIRLHMLGKSNIEGLNPEYGKIAIDAPDTTGDPAKVVKGDQHLGDLLYHSDAVVSCSSLAIDATIFDKPSVFIGFDAVPKNFGEGLTRFSNLECVTRLCGIGGVRMAKTPAQLAEYVKNYLDNPALDRQGRKEIVDQYCWKLDGGAGERLVQAVKDCIPK